MLIYIVEDDFLKANRLKALLNENIANIDCRIHGSFQSGLRAIQQATPDLVVLDMTLPTFDRAGSDRFRGRARAAHGHARNRTACCGAGA